jgi:hypothetical protein
MTFVKVLAIVLSMQAILAAQYQDPALRKGSTPSNVRSVEPKVEVRRTGRSRDSSPGIASANTNTTSRELEKVENKGTRSLHTAPGGSSRGLEKVENERMSSSHRTISQSLKNQSRPRATAMPGNPYPQARNDRNKPINFSYHPSSVSGKQTTKPADKKTGTSNSLH